MPSNLEAKIEEKRAEMVKAGMLLGLTNPVTVGLSQQLDELLNQQTRQEAGANTEAAKR